jgi:hypothetical protein
MSGSGAPGLHRTFAEAPEPACPAVGSSHVAARISVRQSGRHRPNAARVFRNIAFPGTFFALAAASAALAIAVH